ncbi:NAD(P)-dependent dehydrogenase (short-subunit alcohol dehydrogenase family) [Chitinophaga polysaccharea]|uniref:NAD(P)-dependent dehydrogenase (Short-subunit alcohol dehydrogenase family) n=1 Tax=Chitinophaga polysaccharea TaxID=1293035 RepID=A0A561PA57_9BACT|nr:SDR family oxidoreductase [Chitinophaga polysaccharea]TWF34958.1 NAD(P)-dependent dehydrogenase (short-subunit alcohol dehydrogenase family) [Chitinophaga polysaccharea]
MEKIFENKVAIVTGGSFGIGRATAVAFAKRGANVVIADWIEDEEQLTLKQIEAAGGNGFFVKCDVSKPGDITAVIDKAFSAYGRLDFAFNNAGIEGISAVTQECTQDNWERTIAINLTGVWLCMKHELSHMIRQGRGAIVNCASVAGLIGFAGLPAYVASKHGVIGLTKTAALETAKLGVRVNAVCPGVIRTAMIDRITGKDKVVEQQFVNMEPIGRFGEPEEVAEAVIWLCSDEASFVTGHAMPVDGGWIAA